MIAPEEVGEENASNQQHPTNDDDQRRTSLRNDFEQEWHPNFINYSLFGRKATRSSRQCLCMPKRPIEAPLIFARLRHVEGLSDGMVFCEDGTEFKISRLILAIVSPYFKTLFTNSINSTDQEVTVASISAPGYIFTKMLDFAYTGHCQIDINTWAPLMQYADQYEIIGLMRLCCEFILDCMTPENCLRLFREARKFFCKHLEDRSFEFIRLHFTDVVRESPEFSHLSVTDITELLTDDRLNVHSENIVFEAVQKWLQFDKLRSQHLTLISSIRLGHLNVEYLEYIKAWPPIADKPECQILISTVLDFLSMQQSDFDIIRNPYARPRIPKDIPFVIGGLRAGTATSIVETYDCKIKKWFISQHTAIQRAYHGVCTLDGLIYVIGGYDGMNFFNTTHAYDPVTLSLRNCSCMHYPRGHVAVVTHDGQIYAIGGRSRTEGQRGLKSVERYDPTLNQWELVEPMLTERSDASAACVDGKIYVVGGISGFQPLSSCEIYDPVLNQWSYGPKMSTDRSGVSLVQYDGTLYALGGTDCNSTLNTGERLLAQSGAWIPINRMGHARSNFSAVVLDRCILAIGGKNDSSIIKSVESYNIDNGVWQEISPINISGCGISACVVSGLSNSADYSFVGHLLRRKIIFKDP